MPQATAPFRHRIVACAPAARQKRSECVPVPKQTRQKTRCSSPRWVWGWPSECDPSCDDDGGNVRLAARWPATPSRPTTKACSTWRGAFRRGRWNAAASCSWRGRQGKRTDLGPAPAISRKQAAEDAGLSPRQAKDAVRIASIPGVCSTSSSTASIRRQSPRGYRLSRKQAASTFSGGPLSRPRVRFRLSRGAAKL